MYLFGRQRGPYYEQDNGDNGNGSGSGDGDGQGILSSGDEKGGDDDKPGDGEWFYADGVKGEGDKPDFLDDKFKTLADQAKGYKDLQSKQGKEGRFYGPPDGDYELNVPDGITGKFNAEDPLLKGFLEDAKKVGLSQEGVDILVGRYISETIGSQESAEERAARVANDLGENGQLIISDTWDRLKATGMDEELLKGLDDSLGNANAIKALGFLLENEVKLPGTLGEGADTLTPEIARKAKFEVYPDGHAKAGQRMYGDPDNPEHTKKVDAMYARLYPGKDVQTIDVQTA